MTDAGNKKGEKAPFCAKVDGKIPLSRAKEFHILGKLGEGQKATVYLACSTGGHVCAVKEYHMYPSSKTADEARKAEEELQRSYLYEIAVKEAGLWMELYGPPPKKKGKKGGKQEEKIDVYDSSAARPMYLGTRPCLLMPYGDEAEKDSDRWMQVPKVGLELMRFAEKGYMYEDSYLPWRHVLLNGEGNVFFCDLDSLEGCDEAMKTDKRKQKEAVYNQLEILLRTMKPGDMNGTLEWLRSSLDDVVSFIDGVDTLSRYFYNFACGQAALRGYLQALFTARELSDEAEVGLTMVHLAKSIHSDINEETKSKRQKTA